MKKLATILLALVTTVAYAQKETLVVGAVEGNSGVDSKYVTMLKSAVISGLNKVGRLNVVDGANIDNLSKQPSEAIAQLSKIEGVTSLITVKLENFTITTESTSDGKTKYSARMDYSYTITSVADGSIISTDKKTRYGSSLSNKDEAYSSSISLVESDMKGLVNKAFRLSGQIKALNETHPKKGARTVYVDLGSDDGITTGVIFEVFKKVEIAGEIISEKIAEIKVKEIKSGKLCLCTVSKGGTEIQDAYENEIPLIVVSRPTTSLLDVIDAL